MAQKKMQLMMLGDGSVGKTSMITMYKDQAFKETHMATIGVDYVSTTYTSASGEEVAVKIWDTAGQERFQSMTRTFYKQANGIVVVFDVTNQESFASVKRWISDIHQHADPSIIKVLVGNKIDLK